MKLNYLPAGSGRMNGQLTLIVLLMNTVKTEGFSADTENRISTCRKLFTLLLIAH
jgi:hypothetical protein